MSGQGGGYGMNKMGMGGGNPWMRQGMYANAPQYGSMQQAYNPMLPDSGGYTSGSQQTPQVAQGPSSMVPSWANQNSQPSQTPMNDNYDPNSRAAQLNAMGGGA